MSSEGYQLSAAERQLVADSERIAQYRVPTTEEFQLRADAMNVAAGLPPLYSQSTSVAGIGPTLNSAGNLSVGSLYQDVGGALTDAFGAITGGLINGAAGVVAGVTDVIGGIADIPNQIFGKFVQQPSSPKYGMSERGTTTQGTGTSTSVKQDIAKNTAVPVKMQYPLNQSSRFKFAISISKYVKPNPLSPPQKIENASIFLPIPANLVDRFSVDLQDVNVGAVTGEIASALSNIAMGPGSAEEKIKQGLSQVSGQGKEIAIDLLKGLAINAIQTAGQAASIDPQAIVSTALGVSINPGAAVMFKGVRMRPDHTFQWRLTPRNSQEAQAIKQIVGKLRQSMLPSFEGIGVVFNYPNIFNIAILPEDNPMFPKFKSCFLESMEVNYAPSGPSFHGDNVPTEIDLKLTFQELVIFTANDFDPVTGDYVEPGLTPAPRDNRAPSSPSSTGSPVSTPEKVATDAVGSAVGQTVPENSGGVGSSIGAFFGARAPSSGSTEQTTPETQQSAPRRNGRPY